VYEWKFINCLELWTGAICAYSSEADLRPLAYPLTQIISGVARLVPTARYFPLRLRCAKMLNRIAASTGTFIPVSLFLLEMLEMKELNRPPTGGVGKAVDLRTLLKVLLGMNILCSYKSHYAALLLTWIWIIFYAR
jgi:nucleolar complex protein 2